MRLGTLILIVVLVAVGYFVTAPWWTFRSMRDAARNGDEAELAKVIDYDAVRRGLADQLAGRAPEPPPPSIWSNPVGALTHMLKPPPPTPPQTERYVSARAIAAMADGRRPWTGALPSGQHEPFPVIAFWGPDRCRISVADPEDGARKTQFVFERKGIFSWKLEGIELPARRTSSRPARSHTPAARTRSRAPA